LRDFSFFFLIFFIWFDEYFLLILFTPMCTEVFALFWSLFLMVIHQC
jgi:hypothetical protein